MVIISGVGQLTVVRACPFKGAPKNGSVSERADSIHTFQLTTARARGSADSFNERGVTA